MIKAILSWILTRSIIYGPIIWYSATHQNKMTTKEHYRECKYEGRECPLFYCEDDEAVEYHWKNPKL